jgi:DNA-binding CsgD family transcriptional regulator
MGIDKADYERYGELSILNAYPEEHLHHFKLLPIYFQQYWSQIPLQYKKDVIFDTLGLKILHKDKGYIRLLSRRYVIELNSIGLPAYTIFFNQDVTYLLKDDFFWIRFACLKEPDKFLVCHDGTKEVLKGDILSVREKEILKLIIAGKSSEEIAESLFISKITVNNHRQNMLNRVGVKDTTGLVILSKLCNLV